MTFAKAWTSLVFTLMIPATTEPRVMLSFRLTTQLRRFSSSKPEKTSKLLTKSEIYSLDRTSCNH